ncbi:MAG TPA: metallophosphoesterase [Verrucomicrobiae bacterium]|jgi:predicted phosphodiesterase|nr:metallophosphoesterase [Verrucomicrobiae bacterium]
MLLSQLLRRPLSSWWLALALAILALALPAGARADGRWLLVSDIHLDPFDRSALPATPGNDTNAALLRSAIAKMRAADTDPAVVVLAGDFLAHRFDDLAKRGAPHATEQATALNAMASIEREVAAAFPHARFLVALGNNDDPCGDYRVSYDNSYLRALAKIWAPLVDRAAAAPNFAHDFGADGAYVAASPIAGLRVVVANSVYWSPYYAAACSSVARPGDVELTWLQRTLSSTPPGERNLVLMHVPPGIDGYSTAFIHGATTISFLDPQAGSRLIGMLGAPRNRVTFALAGHTHELQLRDVRGVPMLIVPSISPIYGRPPSFLVATVGSDGTIADYTGDVYDYGTASWGVTYDFNRAFAARGINAASLAAIHARMVSGWKPPAQVQTSADRFAICAQTEMTAKGFNGCAGMPNRRVYILLSIVAAVILAVVGWATLMLSARRQKVV